MWTRYDLKMNAKMAFKRNYWTCVADKSGGRSFEWKYVLPVPEAVCRLRWRYSIIIHMRMTVTAHILITAAIRYSGELFFLR